MLGIETEEALLFIKALSLPRTPLPQHAHIEAVGMALLRDILLDADAPTEQVPERYEALVAAIAAASKVESTSTSPAATLHGLIESGPSATLSDRYLDVERLASVLDLAPSGAAGDIPALVPSRSFVGRRELLDELWELLHPDVGDRVVPVALSGLGGIGKTSLAVQFAALYSDEFRTVILDGSDRSLLVEGLSRAGVEVPDPSGGVLTAVASAFPGGPRTLWLIDGVRTLEAIRGLVPGENEARIIITTTSAAVAATFRKLEVTHWQPNESISYIRDALPTSSPDEAAQLAACLHHIPLAICQAVAVCGVTQRTIPGYLELLASQPASTLGLAVSRSDRTVLTTTMLSVDTVRQQMPLAVDLLRLLAHMGSAATPEVMLQNWSAVVWLPDEPRLFPADPEALAEVSPFAEMVGGPVQRTQAIALLVDAALLTIRNHDLSVHPLIQHIVRERCVGDVHPLLHVGIGLFWESDPENGIKPTMIREGTQLLSLLELAHREGVSGPALHLQESSVAEWLVTMGRYEEAREFADRALTWARSIPSTEPLQRSNLCYFRLSAAKTRYACGDPDVAMNLLGENWDDLGDVADPRVTVATVYDLGCYVADEDDIALRSNVLSIIPPTSERPPLSPDLEVRVLATRARLMASLNRFDEARVELANAYTMLAKLPPETTVTIADDLARIAGNCDFVPKQAQPDDRLIDRVRASTEEPRRDLALLLLDAAERHLNHGDYPTAKAALAEAEAIFREHYPADAEILASHLAIEGRLKFSLSEISLDRQALTEADAILQEALAVNEALPRPAAKVLAALHFHLAQTALVLRPDSALQHAEAALAMDAKFYPAGHAELERDKDMIDLISMLVNRDRDR